jgi:putative toxin-antitoxin system antitoxin component (TIGR02293 family)
MRSSKKTEQVSKQSPIPARQEGVPVSRERFVIEQTKGGNFVIKTKDGEIIAQGLGRAPRRVSRDPALDMVSESQSAVSYAAVLSHAVDTFGSRANANAWLNKPNRVFHNQSPLQILTQDPAAVEEELVRIDHGMFI